MFEGMCQKDPLFSQAIVQKASGPQMHFLFAFLFILPAHNMFLGFSNRNLPSNRPKENDSPSHLREEIYYFISIRQPRAFHNTSAQPQGSTHQRCLVMSCHRTPVSTHTACVTQAQVVTAQRHVADVIKLLLFNISDLSRETLTRDNPTYSRG